MRKLLGVSLLIGSLLLTGCGVSTMTKPDSKKLANGFKTEVSNYERISDSVVHLIFEQDLDEVDHRFYWDDFQKELIQKLNSNGVTVSPEGTPVSVKMDKFRLFGSSHSSVRNNTAGGFSVITQVGGAVGVGLAAATVASDTQKSKKDDGRNFVPAMDFTIEKLDGSYSTKVRMTSIVQMSNYLKKPKDVSVQAVSEFFEPVPKQ